MAGKGWLAHTLAELLEQLGELRREETKNALYGLRFMAEKRPVEVVKFLGCFVQLMKDNKVTNVEGNRILLARCESAAKPLLNELSAEMNRTATYMRNLAVGSPNKTMAFFSALLEELKKEAGL